MMTKKEVKFSPFIKYETQTETRSDRYDRKISKDLEVKMTANR